MPPLLALCCAAAVSAPTLTLPSVAGPVAQATLAGTEQLPIRVTVRVGTGPEVEVPVEGLPAIPLALDGVADGPQPVVVNLWGEGWYPTVTHLEGTVTVDATPPRLEVAERSLHGAQGMAWPLDARSNEALQQFTVTVGTHTWPLYLQPDSTWAAVLGFAADHPPGPQVATLRAVDHAGNAAEVPVVVDVADTAFARGGYVQLSAAQTEARKDDAAIAAMKEARGLAYATDVPQALWSGPFQRPTAGRLTSPFGKERAYSDGRVTHHAGADLGGAVGAPVVAPAAGRVVLAEAQAIFGNVVILHHGQGLSTSYNHLSRIDVAAGDVVEPGQQLGLLGATGQASGPHLHWGMIVGAAIAVDPMPWLEPAPLAPPAWVPAP